jgi:DnaJ family protein A protein 2
MGDNEYYERLGLNRNSNIDEIKKAYKKMCLKWHPDKNPDNIEKAKHEFQKIQEAYEVLSDDNKREIYNRHGKAGLEQQQGGPGGMGMNPNDIFASMFGGGIFGMNINMGGNMGQMKNQKRPVGDHKLFPIEVSYEEMMNGTTKRLNITRRIKCSYCFGSGTKSGHQSTCDDCKGAGIRVMIRQLGPGMIQQAQVGCNKCQGTGKMIKDDDKCGGCNGSKYEYEKKFMEIDIEKGIKSGEQIKLEGLGDESDNAEKAGDIIIEIVEKKRENVRREGDNYIVKKPILLSEALCGLSLLYQHINDEIILVETNKVIKPNMRHIISGLGFYNKSKKGNGDLIFEFEIVFPENLQDERKDLIKKLLPKRVNNNKNTEYKVYNIEKSEEIIKSTTKDMNEEYEPMPNESECRVQ